MTGLAQGGRALGRLVACWLWLLAVPSVLAAPLDYGLQARAIATDTYAVFGRTEDFDFDNGGNIVNTAFVVTADGVVVIDTGPSRLYGEQQRALIGRVTDRPVVLVFNTHHHPDHYFGNQAYADVPVLALPATREAMRAEGERFADNLYRMTGLWMRDTEPTPASQSARAGRMSIGGHGFELIELGGHTGADLVILDHATGTLFAGDLVFHDRAPTTPHADLDTWLEALDAVESLSFERLLPGHGPLIERAGAIEETAGYLRWLRQTLVQAVDRGLSMSETMRLPIAAPYDDAPLARREFERSVVHLFPSIENRALRRIDRPEGP